MMRKPGIRNLLVFALALFALVVGISSALVEIATITRLEVESAVARADLAGQIVISQLGFTLRNSSVRPPAAAMNQDPRLNSVLRDAQEFTPSVLYILVADTLSTILLHSDADMVGRAAPVRPQLVPQHGLAALKQFVSIRRETGAYEISRPLLLDNRDFGTVRIGLDASFLRAELKQVLGIQFVKLLAQVLLAMALGIAVSWLIILRPLGRIQEGIQRLQRGEFTYRVPLETGDELGQLASQINLLSETLAREREQFDLQRDSLLNEGNTLRRLVDSLDDGLIMLDRERKILLANRTASRIMGVGVADLAGKKLSGVLTPLHPLVNLVDRAFGSSHGPESGQIELKTADGARVFLVTCQVVADGPTPLGGMVALRDYGRMREIQQLLDHARVLSRLGQMAAGVAHEVRNPLNAMNIHLELLHEKMGAAGVDGSRQEHLDVVRREIARLERVVYGFLKLARLQQLSLTTIDVPGFLNELKALVQPEARMAGVDIQFELHDPIPQLYGDEELLRQALLNLLRNAIQASPPGADPIKVSVRPQGNLVCLEVEDHGPGILPEAQEKVFDLYYTTKKDGTGVGLSLVQQVVEMHGGTIGLNSSPETGTCFIVSLPAIERV